MSAPIKPAAATGKPVRYPVLPKYWKVFDIGLQNTFVYRWNFLLRALFSVVPLLGTVFIWRAIFEERGASIGGYDYGAMIFYFLLTILVDNLVTQRKTSGRSLRTFGMGALAPSSRNR